MKEVETGCACSSNEEMRNASKFGLKTSREGKQSVDERVILETYFKEVRRVAVDRIYLIQDRIQWRAFVNTEINLLIA
jgi:hypothetical protein